MRSACCEWRPMCCCLTIFVLPALLIALQRNRIAFHARRCYLNLKWNRVWCACLDGERITVPVSLDDCFFCSQVHCGSRADWCTWRNYRNHRRQMGDQDHSNAAITFTRNRSGAFRIRISREMKTTQNQITKTETIRRKKCDSSATHRQRFNEWLKNDGHLIRTYVRPIITIKFTLHDDSIYEFPI